MSPKAKALGEQPVTSIPGFTDDPGNPGRTQWPVSGIMLRHYFAAMAMQGLLACPTTKGELSLFAVESVGYADALLEELAKTT